MPTYSNPLNAPDQAPAKAAVPAVPAPAFNARPSKDANSGASPAMVGDKQAIPRAAAHAIAKADPTPATQRGQSYQASGMDRAMGALADKMHAPKRR